MNDYNSDGTSDNEWDDRGGLAWNEFDWELYLRNQDEVMFRYLAHYERLPASSNRLDDAAKQMGWGEEYDDDDSAPPPIGEDYDDEEPYTLHQNPAFIATRALYLSLSRAWEELSSTQPGFPASFATTFAMSLHKGEMQAILAMQSLDFCDYAIAVSLFKRALTELNHSMTLLASPILEKHRAGSAYAKEARLRLFDLREIWLRVMNECREELELGLDDEDDD